MKEINNVRNVVGGGVKENAAIAKSVCSEGVASVNTNGFSCK